LRRGYNNAAAAASVVFARDRSLAAPCALGDVRVVS
jgi:hypothetical protein